MGLSFKFGTAAFIAAGAIQSSAFAAYFASSVVDYTAGTLGQFSQPYQNQGAAVGSPDPLVGAGSPYQETLNPFSPAYGTDQIVVIGEGGSLTLKLSVPVKTNLGPAIGVISNVGLQDESFNHTDNSVPPGTNTNPASTFGGGSAKVEVSADGKTWVTAAASQKFDAPANYFTDTGANASEPGQQTSDFGKPFSGSLPDFDRKSYAQTLTVLDGSGGGKWLNLDGTGLAEVQYVRFSIADDGNVNTSLQLPIDAVAENTAAVDLSSVPEPTVMAMLCVLPLALRRRRLRNR